ncbi:hypothetical protein CAPTEDRAFT_220652 [Capitella teleta]|uniref:Sodium/solute symporter n=1 Tax=Capitella teleta TaxID=283909 RepID=R7TS23_CAPTE|nr:hypothetical protein CAPTEDRAFT_220652 [Capitella teleta]|eukprot:ELT93800.1 hypothetical protein CAPTEDRAFT_220652 [Capitella teleta]
MPGFTTILIATRENTLVNQALANKIHTRLIKCLILYDHELLYIGPAMYAPSLALEAATGFPIKLSIPIMAVVATTYTALGGMRAVIWTDVFQSGIMLCGLLAVLVKVHIPRVAWKLVEYLKPFIMRRKKGDFLLFRKIFVHESVLLNIPFVFLLVCLAFTNGVMVLAYFAKERCDPLLNGDISSSNQILPYFVKIVFASTRGFSGLFLATLYSGALSSVSSSLSGCAANTWEDILKPHLVNLSDFRAAVLNKCLVVIYGVIGAAVAFLAAIMPGPVSQVSMSFSSATGGPLYGMFFLGGISASSNWQGALIGCGAGSAINLWIVFGSQSIPAFNPTLPPLPSDNCPMFNETLTAANTTSVDISLHGIEHLYAVSYLWYAVIGCFVTLAVGWIASQIFNTVGQNKSKKETDARLRLPWKAMLTFSTLPPLDIDDDSCYDFEDIKKTTGETDVMLAKDDQETNAI